MRRDPERGRQHAGEPPDHDPRPERQEENGEEFTKAEWDMLVPEWRWMNEDTLVADSGTRPAVLTTSPTSEHLKTWRTPGVLKPLTPETPVARLIQAAPELRDALQELLIASDPAYAADQGEDVPEERYHEAVERAKNILERLEDPHER